LGRTTPETRRELSIARFEISWFARLFTNGNSFWLVCKNRNAVAEGQNAAATRRTI
jgi:hypothetical protein